MGGVGGVEAVMSDGGPVDEAPMPLVGGCVEANDGSDDGLHV